MFIPWQLGSDNEVPILFFANKMDMPAAATPMEVVQALSLDQLQV